MGEDAHFEAVGTAIERAGGIPTQFTGAGPEEGCRRALAAGQAMLGELARLSRTLADEVLAVGGGILAS